MLYPIRAYAVENINEKYPYFLKLFLKNIDEVSPHNPVLIKIKTNTASFNIFFGNNANIRFNGLIV